MNVDQKTLQSCLPSASAQSIATFSAPLNATFREFSINTVYRVATFLAQIAHESGNLRFVRENLNYSAEGLLKVFPKYFTPELAQKYQRNPKAIASRVYANRMGNGDEQSEDGWKYCGRGLIQITGKTNYKTCGDFLRVDLISDPAHLEMSEGATRSAGWYWYSRGLNAFADVGDMKEITKKINGGYNGLEDRMKHYTHILGVLSA